MKNRLKLSGKLSKRKLKYGALSTALTAAFVVVVLLVNVAAGLLGEKINLKLDLTNEKLFEISQETKDYVKTLKEEVTISICTTEQQFSSTVLELIKQYTKISDQIKFQAVDVTLNPDFAKQFPNDTITAASVVVTTDHSAKVLDSNDFYTLSQDRQSITGMKAEQKLTSALMYVTSENVPIAYFTEGHEEFSPALYRQMMGDNNLQVESLNLLTGTIDPKAEYMVIFRPTKDFTVEELRVLEDFADQGDKNILIYLDAQVPALPNLNEFLNEWGLSVNPSVILDGEKYISSPLNLVANYPESEITAALAAGKVVTVMPNACEIQVLFESDGGVTTFPILNTYDSSYIKKGEIKSQTDVPKTDQDQAGPFVIAAGASKSYSGTNRVKTTNLMVFGSAAMATDSSLAMSSAGNAQVVLKSTMFGKEQTDMVSITPKYFDDLSFMLDGKKVQSIMITFVIVLPLAIMAVGLVMWLKRKNK